MKKETKNRYVGFRLTEKEFAVVNKFCAIKGLAISDLVRHYLPSGDSPLELECAKQDFIQLVNDLLAVEVKKLKRKRPILKLVPNFIIKKTILLSKKRQENHKTAFTAASSFVFGLIMNLSLLNSFLVAGELGGETCIINMQDFAVFASQWQKSEPNITDPNTDFNSDGTVDYNDLRLFCSDYLVKDMNNPCSWDVDNPPTAENVNAATYEFYRETIALSGSDDNYGGSRIHYIITSLPTGAYLTDPAVSGGLITASLLPYRISENGNEVVFTTDTNGLYSFNYKVNDGVNDSNTAVVDVNVAENPQDCLNYDGVNGGEGYFVVDDANSFNLCDLSNNSGFLLFIKTRDTDLTLMKKRDLGAGYEFKIDDGFPIVQLYDANGLYREFKQDIKINIGQWVCFGFFYGYNADGIDVAITSSFFSQDGLSWSFDDSQQYFDVEDVNFANAAPLYVCNKMGTIDRLRFYTGINPNTALLSISASSLEGRNSIGVGMFASTPVIRFGFTNTNTDEILSLSGTIADSNVVGFEPFEVDLRNVIKADRWYSEDGFVNRNGEDLGSNDKFRFRKF